MKPHPQEAAATAKFPTHQMKPAQIADLTQKRAESIKAHPAYATTPSIQQATANWLAASADVNKCDQDIKAQRVALVALIAARDVAVAAYKRTTTAMLTTVDATSAGSPKAIKEWGFDISTRQVVVPTLDAPTGLRVSYNKDFGAVIHWKAVVGQRGYQVQIGDGTPTGFGPVINVPKSRYAPQSLTPGQHIGIRVAVQRKNGLSAWSDMLSVTIR